jgi:hypothetical protein
MDIDLAAFRVIAWPVINELHRKGKGARPTPEELTGALYDALSVAGMEVTTRACHDAGRAPSLLGSACNVRGRDTSQADQSPFIYAGVRNKRERPLPSLG